MRVEIPIMAKLHLLPEASDSEAFELIETMVLIGRRPDNTLQIEDDNVSKYHALLVKTEDGYRLYDLHSVNGTYVNDQRVTTAILKNNDQLRIGPAIFRFESAPVPAAAPAPVVQPKIRFAGRLGGTPLGHKPGTVPTTISPPSPPPPTPVPVSVPSLVPEPTRPPSASVVPTTATPAQAVPVAEAATPPKPAPTVPAKKEEPRVSIRIPESKKFIIAPPATTSDAKETQVTKPAEPEAASKPRLGLGLKRPATITPEPAPAPAAATTLGGPKPPAAERSLRPKLGGGGGGEMRLNLKK